MRISILSLVLFSTLLFTSCEKKGLTDKDAFKDDLKEEKGEDLKDDKECFVLVYPITYTFSDGTTISGDQKEVDTAIKSWYEAHPDSKEKPSLTYPVDINWGDEKVYTIADEEAMIELKKKCSDKGACFKLVDPITYTMPDGTTISGDQKEVDSAIKSWYEAHPDSKEKPSLTYPVDINWGDEKVYTIADEEAMIELKKKCEQEEQEKEKENKDGK